MRRARLLSCALALSIGVLVLMLQIPAFAQLPTATISGTVKDPSGAAIPGATVTATNRETGLVRTQKSGPDGHYDFASLPVGVYDVKSEASGFQSKLQQNLNLSVGQEAVLNFALTVGTVQETVTVTAEAPLVNTTSGSLGGLVNEDRVAELPLNGRSFNSLVLLQTGVTVHHPSSTTSSTSIGLDFSSNGAPIRSNFMTMDGASITNSQGLTGVSTSGLMLGVDAIREFRVISNNFPAEYGMTMGSQIVIVSKGGTNQVHGSVFDFLRNAVLDAHPFFLATRPGYHRNNFGGSLGGPIRKDKDFFFVSYEGLRELQGIPIVMSVPNQLARTGGLPGASTIAPAVVPYLNLYPLPTSALVSDPTGAKGVGQFSYAFEQPTNEDYGQFRIDHNFSDSDQLFGRYTIDDTRKTAPNGSNSSIFTEEEDSRGQYITVAENHTFSPTVLNVGRLSMVRPVQSFTLPVAPGTENLGFLPGLQMGAVAPGSGVTGLAGGIPINYSQTGFNLSDDISVVRGNHSLKFGTLINKDRTYLLVQTNLFGSWSFNSLAQFLTNVPNTLSIIAPGSVTDRTYAWYTLGFYAQDEWRATSRLTLDVGLRYEFNTSVNEVTGTGSGIRSILTSTVPTIAPPLYNNPSFKNFGPRFGFAWDVKGDGKTAVRGGFGVFYDIANLVSAADIETTATPPFSKTLSLGTTNGLCFPSCTAVPNVQNATSPALRTIEWQQGQPHMLSYNLTVDHQLPGSILISAGFAGSRGLDLIQTVQGNPEIPNSITPAGELGSVGTYFWDPSNPLGRENPNFSTCECKTTGGDSWYNSLQVRVAKQATHNLQFQASYTFSKLLDDTQGQHGGEAGGSSITGVDEYSLAGDKGPADFNDTNYFTFNTLYTLPAPAWQGVGGALVKGWRMGSIVTMNSGLPFTVTLSGNRSNSDGNTGESDRPNAVQGCSVILGGFNQYFNPACFTIPTAGYLGTLGRNTLTGPWHANLDFSLVKDTRVAEGKQLEFRAEFFNLFNRTDFNIPSGTTVYTATATQATTTPLSTAGQITRTLEPPREIQFALKFIF